MSYSNYQLNQRVSNLYNAINGFFNGNTTIEFSPTVALTTTINTTDTANAILILQSLPSNPIPSIASYFQLAPIPSNTVINKLDYSFTRMPINAKYKCTIVNTSGRIIYNANSFTIVNQPPLDTNVYLVRCLGTNYTTGRQVNTIIKISRVSLLLFIVELIAPNIV